MDQIRIKTRPWMTLFFFLLTLIEGIVVSYCVWLWDVHSLMIFTADVISAHQIYGHWVFYPYWQFTHIFDYGVFIWFVFVFIILMFRLLLPSFGKVGTPLHYVLSFFILVFTDGSAFVFYSPDLILMLIIASLFSLITFCRILLGQFSFVLIPK